jgi:hypothetical protein
MTSGVSRQRRTQRSTNARREAVGVDEVDEVAVAGPLLDLDVPHARVPLARSPSGLAVLELRGTVPGVDAERLWRDALRALQRVGRRLRPHLHLHGAVQRDDRRGRRRGSREGKNLKGRALGFVLGTVGKSRLEKEFGKTVKAIESRNGVA